MGFSSKATKMAHDGLVCCLWLLVARWGFRQRQPEWLPTGSSAAFRSRTQDGRSAKGNQNGFRRALLLPFVLGHKMEAPPEATKTPSDMLFCCLCRRPNETVQGQRQQPRLGGRILLPFALENKKKRTVDPNANESTVLKRKVLDYMRS